MVINSRKKIKCDEGQSNILNNIQTFEASNNKSILTNNNNVNSKFQ